LKCVWGFILYRDHVENQFGVPKKNSGFNPPKKISEPLGCRLGFLKIQKENYDEEGRRAQYQ